MMSNCSSARPSAAWREKPSSRWASSIAPQAVAQVIHRSPKVHFVSAAGNSSHDGFSPETAKALPTQPSPGPGETILVFSGTFAMDTTPLDLSGDGTTGVHLVGQRPGRYRSHQQCAADRRPCNRQAGQWLAYFRPDHPGNCRHVHVDRPISGAAGRGRRADPVRRRGFAKRATYRRQRRNLRQHAERSHHAFCPRLRDSDEI